MNASIEKFADQVTGNAIRSSPNTWQLAGGIVGLVWFLNITYTVFWHNTWVSFILRRTKCFQLMSLQGFLTWRDYGMRDLKKHRETERASELRLIICCGQINHLDSLE
jgi:hypothetical protein